ncbi:hypothetical protein HGRIS_001834 [Hohenbuehelia grisea]|uniref:Uncharacterized protein n=1 Tax=Hohenbuehelia grisea TaxID=104357 RepID=A0ABR3JJW1_9AGAR
MDANCSYICRLLGEWHLSSYGVPEDWLEVDADDTNSNDELKHLLPQFDLRAAAMPLALKLVKHRMNPLAKASLDIISDDPHSLSPDFQLASCRTLLQDNPPTTCVAALSRKSFADQAANQVMFTLLHSGTLGSMSYLLSFTVACKKNARARLYCACQSDMSKMNFL